MVEAAHHVSTLHPLHIASPQQHISGPFTDHSKASLHKHINMHPITAQPLGAQTPFPTHPTRQRTWLTDAVTASPTTPPSPSQTMHELGLVDRPNCRIIRHSSVSEGGCYALKGWWLQL